MTARSLKHIGLTSKRLEFLQTHASQPSACLREHLPGQRNLFLTQRTQALRHLQQTYALERRCFL